MLRNNASYRWSPILLALVGVMGCSSSQDDVIAPWAIDPASLKPVSGTITLNGKPLPKVVVAFISVGGVPSVGETGLDGRYTLQTMSMNGVPPGNYKVVFSYFLATNGEAQGLSQRSAMVHSDAMRSAKESLPPSYADINQTKLRATVEGERRDFDFDINATPQAPEPINVDQKAPLSQEEKPDNAEAKKAGDKAPGHPE